MKNSVVRGGHCAAKVYLFATTSFGGGCEIGSMEKESIDQIHSYL
jgi:hypothetical protein